MQNLPKKGNFDLKQKKRTSPWNSEYSHETSYQISVYAHNFDFLDQVCQKAYLQSKVEIVNTTIGFCIFALAKVPNFSLN